MAIDMYPMVGSGYQQLRQDNIGKHHKASQGVVVTNWEDMIAVGPIRASGYTVVNMETRLPSGVANLPGRRALAIYNNGNDPIFVGPTGVSVTGGYPIPSGVEKAFAFAANLDLYAIAASGKAVNIRVFEIA